MAARTRLHPWLLVALSLVACTSSSSPPSATSLEPSASPEASISEAPAASEGAALTPVPCVPGVVCGGALAPGEYTSTTTGATLTFTLAGEGWTAAGVDAPGGFGLANAAVGGPNAIWALSFSGEVNSEPCDAATETIGTTPADFIAFVAAVDGVQAEAPVDVTVGGRPAIQLDLTTESPCPGSGQMRVWTLPDGGFYFDDGEQARVYAVDAGSATVVIVIDVWSPTSDYAVLLQKADELIATLTITPAS